MVFWGGLSLSFCSKATNLITGSEKRYINNILCSNYSPLVNSTHDALLESYKINKGSRCNTLFFSHQLFTAFQTDTVI